MQGSVRRFLVTAGGTREPIDAVRDWGNLFTGNTGYAIARQLSRLGHVDLLTSNATHVAELREEGAGATASPEGQAVPTMPPETASVEEAVASGRNITAVGFRTHAQLRALLEQRMAQHPYDAVFMTAAVADYRPVRAYEVVSRKPAEDGEHWIVRDVHAAKVKSQFQQIAILGQRTEKLVDLFRSAWGFGGLLVKFKLEVGIEVEQLLEIGRASRIASGADYLVANTLEMVEGPNAGAYLIGPDGERFIPRHELAPCLAELADRPSAGRPV